MLQYQDFPAYLLLASPRCDLSLAQVKEPHEIPDQPLEPEILPDLPPEQEPDVSPELPTCPTPEITPVQEPEINPFRENRFRG